MEMVQIEFTLNGERVVGRTPPHRTLLQFLRDEIQATEVKYGCGEGVCGACAVLLDGQAVNSCLTLAVQAHGRQVTTVRGLLQDGELHPLQAAFVAEGAVQCGFCTPGILITLLDHLQHHPHPSREEIRQMLAGNLCRCTGYRKIIKAVERYTLSVE
ncbi:MAG: (2Fe-2S)-binding protein [Nitrospinota bacterium]|nr:MAG: (2Fe-2S)-binding protein [Nitrospinota bacterium]